VIVVELPRDPRLSPWMYVHAARDLLSERFGEYYGSVGLVDPTRAEAAEAMRREAIDALRDSLACFSVGDTEQASDPTAAAPFKWSYSTLNPRVQRAHGVGDSTATVFFELMVESGEQIVSYTMAVQHDTTADQVAARLYRVDSSGTPTQVGTDQASAASTAVQTLTETVNHTVVANNSYFLFLTAPNIPGAGTVNQFIYNARLAIKRP
jgi:hypothetical protein